MNPKSLIERKAEVASNFMAFARILQSVGLAGFARMLETAQVTDVAELEQAILIFQKQLNRTPK